MTWRAVVLCSFQKATYAAMKLINGHVSYINWILQRGTSSLTRRQRGHFYFWDFSGHCRKNQFCTAWSLASRTNRKLCVRVHDGKCNYYCVGNRLRFFGVDKWRRTGIPISCSVHAPGGWYIVPFGTWFAPARFQFTFDHVCNRSNCREIELFAQYLFVCM